MKSQPATRGRSWRWCATALVVAACNSDQTPTSIATTTSPAGVLVLAIQGLPSGTNGNVIVTDSGFADTLGVSATLSPLTPGTYTITAANVIVPGVLSGIAGVVPTEQAPVTYLPSVTGSRVIGATVPVILDSVTAATVTYAPAPAPAVTLNVSNTIAMTGQQLLVTWSSTRTTACWGQGDGAWSQTPSVATSGSQLLTASGGSNHLSFFSVTCVGTGGGAYADQAVVEQSNTIPGTGTLSVFAYGLPGGTSPSVSVVGQSAAPSGTWTGLAPAVYTVTAANVTAGGVTYVPVPTSQTVRVSADSASNPLVTYAATRPPPLAVRPAGRGAPGVERR